MDKIIRNADEACNILRELVQTPQCYGLHFEFDMSVDEAPHVKYTVRRFAYTTEAEDGRDNA